MKRKAPALPADLPVCPIDDALIEAGETGDDIRGIRFEGDTAEGFGVENLEFVCCSFMNVRFRDCTFAHCSFVDCRFELCDMSLLELTDCSLVRCEISGGKMVGANLNGSFLMHTLFSEVDCEYLNLTEATLKSVEFDTCKLSGSGLDNCEVGVLEFNDCDLVGANLSNTPLEGVDFSSSNIAGLILTGNELEGAVISAFQAVDIVKFLGVRVADYGLGGEEEEQTEE